MCGSARSGTSIASRSSACTSLGFVPWRRHDAHVDRLRLAQRHDRRAEHDAVGDHDAVLPARERRVEQAERADDALGLAGEPAGLQPHALADAERARAQQDGAGDQVAERLLRGEADDDGGEGAADGERARREPGDPQRDDGHDRDRHEPQQEADRAGGARVHAAHQVRADGAAEVARERPAERDQRDRR